MLTKPLGTQIASNAMHWLVENNDKAQKILQVMSRADILDIFARAEGKMATLSNVAAGLMHKHRSKACTDVTGFGLLGHANYLARAQKQAIKFVI